MFLLGLRHGLDPDHIACIDGLTWRCAQPAARSPSRAVDRHPVRPRPRLAGDQHCSGRQQDRAIPVRSGPGRGSVRLDTDGVAPRGRYHEPAPAPPARRRRTFRRDGSFRSFLARFATIPSPWAIVLIGVLFATVFDTATQAAAWGYVASSHGGGDTGCACGRPDLHRRNDRHRYARWPTDLPPEPHDAGQRSEAQRIPHARSSAGWWSAISYSVAVIQHRQGAGARPRAQRDGLLR